MCRWSPLPLVVGGGGHRDSGARFRGSRVENRVGNREIQLFRLAKLFRPIPGGAFS